jgi:hypothetical protein
MPADRPRPTLADYVAVALSPALIMALVASLVFFLQAVLYGGEFQSRMHWILFWFIFAAVLIARISMETAISGRAPVYGAVLAVAVWLGMGQFVEYPPELQVASWFINAGLIAVVWWSAHRLTWDCTYIDEKAEGTGTGVLQAAGLEAARPEAADPEAEAEEGPEPGPAGKKSSTRPGWWERYQRYREGRQKRHTPGVWVVYFSLAALPIFGLGQALIDPEDEERRRHVFWLMAVYAASALGLLVTTAFLGLRRYLRQRKLQMPKAMTGAWLGLGGCLIFVLLVLGALLPRPGAEYSLLSLTPTGSKERDASDYAMKGGDKGKGEGRADQEELDEKKGTPVSGNQPDKKGSGGKGQAQGQGSGDRSGQKNGGSGDKAGQGGDRKSSSADQKKAEGKGDDRDREAKDGEKDDRGENAGQGSRDSSGVKNAKGKRSGTNSRRGRSFLSSLPVLGSVAGVLKWVVFAVLAVLAVAFLLRGGLRWLANFSDWARRLLEALRAFWERLFGGRQGAEAAAEGGFEERAKRPRPFRTFRNPFLNGGAERLSPAELARYSFEALEAWAWERRLARGADETPLEFANRIGAEVPALEAEAKRLAALYARVLYAKGGVPASWRPVLEQFWEKIEAVAEQPLSA